MTPEEVLCAVCGRSFNQANLDQVFYHETHQLRLVSSASRGVQVGPCRACYHEARCEVLLGPSFKSDGTCDWSPSRFQPSYCSEPTEAMKKAWDKSGVIVRNAVRETIEEIVEEGESDGEGSGQAAPAGPKA